MWRGDPGMQDDGRDLGERVNTGVSAPRAMDNDRGPLDGGERLLEKGLDRHPRILPLPPDVIRTVVLECQLQVRSVAREPGFTTGTSLRRAGTTEAGTRDLDCTREYNGRLRRPGSDRDR